MGNPTKIYQIYLYLSFTNLDVPIPTFRDHPSFLQLPCWIGRPELMIHQAQPDCLET
jgi:hypothetical protein